MRRGPECLDPKTCLFPTWWAEWEWLPGSDGVVRTVTFRLWMAASFELGDPRPSFYLTRNAYAAAVPGPRSRRLHDCEPYAEGSFREGDGWMRWVWPAEVVSEDPQFLPSLLGAMTRVREVCVEIMGD